MVSVRAWAFQAVLMDCFLCKIIRKHTAPLAPECEINKRSNFPSWFAKMSVMRKGRVNRLNVLELNFTSPEKSRYIPHT
jgi:hypothetical protein